VQRTCEQAIDFCNRKIQVMKENIDEVGEDIRSKEQALIQMDSVLQDRMAAAQAQGTSGADPGPS
jgi:prefoldin subunit 5